MSESFQFAPAFDQGSYEEPEWFRAAIALVSNYHIPTPVPPTDFDTRSLWAEEGQSSRNIAGGSSQVNPLPMYLMQSVRQTLNTGPQIPAAYPNYLDIYNAIAPGDEQSAESFHDPVHSTTLVSAKLEPMSVYPVN